MGPSQRRAQGEIMQKKIKGTMLAGAVAGMFVAASGFAATNAAGTTSTDNQLATHHAKTVKCQLPAEKNACKGKDGCGGKDGCKSKDSCKGKDAAKGEVKDLTEEECKAQGGTVAE